MKRTKSQRRADKKFAARLKRIQKECSKHVNEHDRYVCWECPYSRLVLDKDEHGIVYSGWHECPLERPDTWDIEKIVELTRGES